MYFDGDRLVQTSGKKTRTIYTTESGWQHVSPFAVSDDTTTAAIIERRDQRYRMRGIELGRGTAATLHEAGDPLRNVRLRPKRAGLLYNYKGALTLVNLDGGGAQQLKIPEGSAGDSHWSADGRRVHYLLTPAEPGKAVQLRENLPDTGEDKLIGVTTQFQSFSRNADSSVFAGVSGSKAAPYFLLLLRAAHRELTIAEHRASDAAKAAILFSPDSQRVFWQTDREGRSAIYMMALERFIERTTKETQ
jgi:oligogalacturonide lyase